MQSPSKEHNVHLCVEHGDVSKLQECVSYWTQRGYPSSVVLHRREELLGLMPLHIAAEKGHLGIVRVSKHKVTAQL